MNQQIAELRERTAADNNSYKPYFFRTGNREEQAAFAGALKEAVFLCDELYEQLKDLIKSRHPKRKLSPEDYRTLIAAHLDGCPPEDYGVWVYYPWSRRMVHLLDEAEFVEVRTNRNIYKITPEERTALSKKRIGVVGLSVGQAVSVTAAMERICGELRLADFDTLELSNLNRIRTGAHNLGIKKVVSVAREISEFDPYLKVVCFEAGLTEENMDAFFLEGGKLDLLIEESDGFDMKILCRHKARALQVPVIMEASDRCMVDVERFDLEPQRPILHGLVDHLDIPTLKSLKTNEEKIPYMLEVLGLDTSSIRLKASMLEIEQTITTWPQLASAVAMGGGITTDVSRRILLNLYTGSGRFHIDIEELIGDKKPVPVLPPVRQPAVVAGDFVQKAAHHRADNQGIRLPEALVTRIVQAGCLAPSGGNVQPWRWVFKNGQLFLFTPFNGTDNYLGYDNLAFYIAQGAASENIVLKAQQEGLDVVLDPFPDPAMPDLSAVYTFFNTGTAADAAPRDYTYLADTIALRGTNRNLGQRTPVDPAVLEALSGLAASVPGISLRFFTSDRELADIGDLVGELEQIRMLDEQGHADFVQEMRWTAEEARDTRDGIDINTLDITHTEQVGLTVARDPAIMSEVVQWKNSGGAFRKLTRKSVDAAAAFGVIYMPDERHESYFRAGRALQRVWLDANRQGLAFQPISASVFMYARLNQGGGAGLNPRTREALYANKERYEKLLYLSPGCYPAFLFRLSQATDIKIRALRKPLTEMFKFVSD